MKITLLIAAVILSSTATFAQTAVNTNATTSANATVNTDAVNKAGSKAEQGTKKVITAANNEKKATEQQLATDVKTTKTKADQNSNVAAELSTQTATATTVAGNNSGQNAYINNQSATTSSSTVNVNTADVKNDVKKLEYVSAKVAVVEKNSVAQVKTTTTKVVTKTKAIKPKPTVKVNTQVSAASAIKIK
ncbi:MAG: hypothetical protein ABJB11_17935 [Ferruginibacter sp.]